MPQPSSTPTPTRLPPFSAASRAKAGRLAMVVNENQRVVAAVTQHLQSYGYEVHTAESGAAALERLRRRHFEVMLCDVRLPDVSGLDVVPLALQIDPHLAVLVVTSVNHAATAKRALERGAADYLLHPVEPETLKAAIREALAKRDARIEKEHLENRVREEVAAKTAELEREKEALRREREAFRALTVSVAETLINAMEAKDVYLRGHSQRVAELAAAIATEMSLGDELVEQIRLAGRLHDVGKIGIREDVLNKPGKLTPEEFAHIQDHVRIGMDILSPLRHLGPVLDFVHDHHEHWDGTGYPRGRSGETISIGGRILTAADAFDALTSKRAYREPMTTDETLVHLRRNCVNTLLEPRVYEALWAVVAKGLAPGVGEPSEG
jgi:response regulator RpfG family c-di-GMP phosphodiesterase